MFLMSTSPRFYWKVPHPFVSQIEDVSAPAEDTDGCACASGGPDGFDDLTLKFKTQDIVNAVCFIPPSGMELTITGTLLDGTTFQSVDCIVGVGNRHPKGGEF
jgi:hypothetical protein